MVDKTRKKSENIHNEYIETGAELMDKMTFLLNMSLSGIKNIEDKIEIDFYGKKVNKSQKTDRNNVKGIYGENGTGKTAIITAVSIVKEFLFNDNYLRDSHNQALLRELINKNTREFFFRCEFVTQVELFLIYEYEVRFVLDENDEVYVSYESLKYRKNSNKNKQMTLFICNNGEFEVLDTAESIRSVVIEKTRNLLSKQSALFLIFMILGKDSDKDVLSIYYICPVLFFLLIFVYFDREDKHSDFIKRNKLNELKNNPSADELRKELLKEIPTNEKRILIRDYSDYVKKIQRLERFVRLFKPDLKKIDIDKTEDKDYYECKLLMNYGSYRVDKEFESTGIKKIIELYDAFVQAANGFIVFIDEMDSNINDIYLCKLIEYFKYYGKGQLCFTSHNVDPMSVLKDSNKSIDFLTRDNRIIPWIKNGHYTPENSYRNGLIEGMPYNIDSSDFISIFERGE